MRTLAKTGAVSSDRHRECPIRLADLAQALDHSDEGFALTDPEGNYVYINHAHLQMFGYERPQDLLGRNWRLLYTAEWVRRFEESVLPVIPRDKVWRGRVLGRRRDGSSFPAGVTLTWLPDGKITCNCRRESAAEPNGSRPALPELQERLITGLPGRLRRPLDMLAGYSALLLGELEAGTPPAADLLRSGLAEIDANRRLIADHLKRLDLLAELANTAPRLPDDWNSRLAAACRERAEQAGRAADLSVDFTPAKMRLHYRALEHVMLELLSNALQSSRCGDAVELSGRPERDAYVLRIRDDGIGLPAGGLDFADDHRLGQPQAHGIGLALVQYILHRLGGSLSHDPAATSGTCLRVRIPLLA